jgi:hypothetical protein
MIDSSAMGANFELAREQLPGPEPYGSTWQSLGELLLGDALVSDGELDTALSDQAASRLPLGEIMVTRGYVSRPTLLRTLAKQRNRELDLERGFGSGLFELIAKEHPRTRPAPLSESAHTDLLCSSVEDQPPDEEQTTLASVLGRFARRT